MLTCATVPNVKRAEKFRAMAETVAGQIEKLRGNYLSNTPKRQREAMSRRVDANNLERVQRALLALADGHEAGTVPPDLADLASRKDIEPMVTRFTESPSYYVVCESREWRQNTPQSVSLRGYVDAWADRFKEQDRERQRAERVRSLEEAVRFSDIPGFFPTPPGLVQAMIEEVEISPGCKVLEPSAGKGDLADAARAAGGVVSCIERNYNLCEILRAKGHTTVCADFTEQKPAAIYDRVVMNPPFENGQDCEHVRLAYQWLVPGGKLVAIMAAGCMFNQARKFQEFREWFDTVGGTWYENDPDAFKSAFRQTSVRTITLVIQRD